MTLAPDEDAWRVPPAWRRHGHPWRGLDPLPTAVDLSAAAELEGLRARHDEVMRRVLNDPLTDAGLAAAARDEPDTPLGAAMLAVALEVAPDLDQPRWLPEHVDVWTASRGVAFAAEATMIGLALDCASPLPYDGPRRFVAHRDPDDLFNLRWPLVSRLREVLCLLDDADHAAALVAIDAHRHGLAASIAGSYVVPQRRDWLADALRAVAASPSVHPFPVAELLTCATTFEEAQAVMDESPRWWVVAQAGLLQTLAAHVGPSIAPVLLRLLDEGPRAADARRLIAMVGRLPTDEAMDGLLERLDLPHVGPGLLPVLRAFPRRAARLLTASPDPRTWELLRLHLLSHPELASALGGSADGCSPNDA